LILHILGPVMWQHEVVPDRRMARAILGADALLVVAVPEESAALLAEAPLLLVLRILVDVVRQHEIVANRPMGRAVLLAAALGVGVAVPEERRAFAAAAVVRLAVRAFGGVVGHEELEAEGLVAFQSVAAGVAGAPADPRAEEELLLVGSPPIRLLLARQ